MRLRDIDYGSVAPVVCMIGVAFLCISVIILALLFGIGVNVDVIKRVFCLSLTPCLVSLFLSLLCFIIDAIQDL